MTSNLASHSMLVLHVSPKSGCLRGARVLHPSPRSAGRCRGRAAGTRGGGACARALPGAILLWPGLARDRAAPRPPPGRTPSSDFARPGSPRGCRSASSPGFPPAQLAGGARFFRSRSSGQDPAGDTARRAAEAPAPPLQPLPRSPRPRTPRSTALTRGGHGGRSGEAKAEPRRRRRRGLSRSRPLLGDSQSIRAPKHGPAPGPRPASRLAGNN